jgi:hypothetical protein
MCRKRGRNLILMSKAKHTEEWKIELPEWDLELPEWNPYIPEWDEAITIWVIELPEWDVLFFGYKKIVW